MPCVDSESEELLVTGFNMPEKNDPRRYGEANIRDPPEVRNRKIKFFHSLIEGVEDATPYILINSFKHLEAPLLPLLKASCFDVKFIGPCFPSWNADIGMGNRMAQQAGSAFVQDGTCLAWLDRQESSSVLFVSFGSEGILGEEQVEELALGIEKSRHKFLWVVRPDLPASSRPSENFRRRNSEHGKERGMFVSWAPQRRVLQHRAVGGFLTHSGWNSTLESIACGVPMLCLPLLADQPLNANLVERYWRVGMRLVATSEKGKSTVVRQETVERGVRAVMEGRYAPQVLQLQKAAHLATLEAHETLASVVHHIKTSNGNYINDGCK